MTPTTAAAPDAATTDPHVPPAASDLARMAEVQARAVRRLEEHGAHAASARQTLAAILSQLRRDGDEAAADRVAASVPYGPLPTATVEPERRVRPEVHVRPAPPSRPAWTVEAERLLTDDPAWSGSTDVVETLRSLHLTDPQLVAAVPVDLDRLRRVARAAGTGDDDAREASWTDALAQVHEALPHLADDDVSSVAFRLGLYEVAHALADQVVPVGIFLLPGEHADLTAGCTAHERGDARGAEHFRRRLNRSLTRRGARHVYGRRVPRGPRRPACTASIAAALRTSPRARGAGRPAGRRTRSTTAASGRGGDSGDPGPGAGDEPGSSPRWHDAERSAGAHSAAQPSAVALWRRWRRRLRRRLRLPLRPLPAVLLEGAVA